MSRFSQRSTEEEIMDDLDSGGEVINQTLRELETINRLLGGNHVTLNGIKRLIDVNQARTWRIVDVGCGGGDILKLMAGWGRKRKIKLELIGIDANPNVIAFAESNCTEFPEISFQTLDIFSQQYKELEFDILTATLFFHHFKDDELVNFIKQSSTQAQVGIVINDLHRHWFAYHSINLLTALFSKSPMVKNDAGISVLRSFKRRDWTQILMSARIESYSIKWMWAFRWQVLIPYSA